MNAFIRWCGSNTTGAKVARTIIQGLVAFLIVLIPQWASGHLIPEATATIIPAIMAVLAAFQSWLGKKGVYEQMEREKSLMIDEVYPEKVGGTDDSDD